MTARFLYDSILDVLAGDDKELLIDAIKDYFDMDDLYDEYELVDAVKDQLTLKDIFSDGEIMDYCAENIEIDQVYSQKCIDNYSSKTGTDIVEILEKYYNTRKLTKPDARQALLFLVSEVGELCDAVVSGSGDWVRNNPNKVKSIEDEIGDVLMMLSVFSIAYNGKSPEIHMENKMKKYFQEKNSL